MIDFFSSLRITLWVIGSFLILLLIHFFWNAFPKLLYAPVLILFYLNLFSCMFKRWRIWKQVSADRIGFTCFHLGMAVIAGGALATTLGRFQGSFEIAQHQEFIDSHNYYELIEGPVLGKPKFSGEFFFLKDVNIELYGNGQLKDFTCTVIRNNNPDNEVTIKPNHPFLLGGGMVYPVVAMHGDAVRFQALYAGGQVTEGSINFPVDSDQHSFVIPGTNELMHVQRVHDRSTAVQLSWNNVTRTMMPGDILRVNNVLLTYLETVPWVGMILTRDPGKPFAYAGFILMSLGLATYYLTGKRR